MLYIKTALANLYKFAKLPAGQQIIFFFGALVLVLCFVIYKKDKKAEAVEHEKNVEWNELKANRKRDEIKVDSLLNYIVQIQMEHANEKITRLDSLLKESEKIKNSINPMVKKLNKKINEVNN